MNEILNRAHGRISRAPLSFGFSCVGIGIVIADIMRNGFGLSALAVWNIGAIIGFAGSVFLETNGKADISTAGSPKGKAGDSTGG